MPMYRARTSETHWETFEFEADSEEEAEEMLNDGNCGDSIASDYEDWEVDSLEEISGEENTRNTPQPQTSDRLYPRIVNDNLRPRNSHSVYDGQPEVSLIDEMVEDRGRAIRQEEMLNMRKMTQITKNLGGREPIQDEFTHLPVSRQRKWALRHRDKQNAFQRKYDRRRRLKLKLEKEQNLIDS